MRAAAIPAFCVLASGFVLQAAPARAHAMLEHAEPRVGSTVAVPPAMVLLSFSAAVDPLASTIMVTNALGARVDAHALTAGSGDGHDLRATLAPLVPGAYRVVWRAVSVDGHRTTGSYGFRIGR